jgi:hypothetical protein
MNNNNNLLVLFIYFLVKKISQTQPKIRYYNLFKFFLNLIVSKSRTFENFDLIFQPNLKAQSQNISQNILKRAKTKRFFLFRNPLMRFFIYLSIGALILYYSNELKRLIRLFVKFFKLKYLDLIRYFSRYKTLTLMYLKLLHKYEVLERDFEALHGDYKQDIGVEFRGMRQRALGFKKSSDYYRKKAEKNESLLDQVMNYLDQTKSIEMPRIQLARKKANQISLNLFEQLNYYQKITQTTIIKYLQIVSRLNNPEIIKYLNNDHNLDNEYLAFRSLVWNIMFMNQDNFDF